MKIYWFTIIIYEILRYYIKYGKKIRILSGKNKFATFIVKIKEEVQPLLFHFAFAYNDILSAEMKS